MKKTIFSVALILICCTAFARIVTPIYDIQFPGGVSPYNGQTVAIEGIVYGVYPSGFAIADAGGAWHGIYVYNSGSGFAMPSVGDRVNVSGTVIEYYEMTEISPVTALTVISSGNTPFAPTFVTTADVATGSANAEQYEGVLVEVQTAVVTNPDLGYGEWAIDDGSGDTRVNDLGSYTYTPAIGDQINFVRGMLNYNFDDYKIEPRDDSDISATPGVPIPFSIFEIQGSGFVSPVAGELVTTSGIVTGFFEGNIPGGGAFEGVFIQDAAGDGNTFTSDGILAVFDSLSGITIAFGDLLEVTGGVREYSEYDGGSCTEDCMTVVLTNVGDATITGTGSVSATVFTPPTDTDDQYEYLEALEGMLITTDGAATVVGPTSFGAVSTVDGDEGVDRVLRGSTQHGKVIAYRHYEKFGDIGGLDPDNLIVGSTVNAAEGPLMMTYGAYTLVTQEGMPWTTVTSAPPPAAAPTWAAPTDGLFTVMTMNTYNLDVGDTTKLDKLVPIVVDAGCPTFVALQEVDTASTVAGQEDEVLSEFVTRLASAGCTYSSANSHPDMGDHGVAVLWRPDLVTSASWTDEYQGCSTVGSQSTVNYDAFCDEVADQYPLFSRRPVVLTATLEATCTSSAAIEVTIITTHLKSQIGGGDADQRRLEQAQFIATLTDTLVAGGSTRVIVAGDLNDFEDAPPLLALTGSGLLSTWDLIPAAQRFSYNFGGMSQALDHQLYSPALAGGRLLGADTLAVNADFPFEPYGDDETVPWRASDHDPVVTTFLACIDDPLFADGFEDGDSSAWSNTFP